MKRVLVTVFTFLFTLFAAIGFVGCQKSVTVNGEYVVIVAKDVSADTTLLEYMEALQSEGELSFTVENGMITAIDGKENADDFSSCWMLYTSDTEFSTAEYGTVEYDGKTYQSAIFGAETLVIKEGESYVWAYVTF